MPEISIGRLRGGFCVYWRDGTGRKRFQLEARNRAEAEAEAIDVYRAKTFEARPRGQTVAQMWEAYRDELHGRAMGKTMKYTGKAILPFFGNHFPDNITKTMCQEYARNRMDAGKAQGTVWTELGHLRSALKFSMKKPPAIWRPAQPETDKRILNAGEARALIDGASAPHIRLALILLLGTAGRVGAILDLTWDRVDFEAGINGVINLRVSDSKTRKGRAVVPMSAGVRAALSVAHDAALSDYVVEHAAGQIKSIRKGFSGAVERSGIGHVTIHELRHTAAVTMLAAGESIEKVAQVLGHSNIATTYRVYARYMPQHMQSAVDVLDFTGIRAV